jgi:hypothetical protein
MDRNRLIERAAKLLAVARSSGANSHEASVAQGLADRLMAGHHISPEEIASHEPSGGVTEKPVGAFRIDEMWKLGLVTACARFYGCEVVSLCVRERRKVRIVGRRRMANLAAQLFLELLKLLSKAERIEAKRLSDLPDYMLFDMDSDPEVYLDSFRRGWVVAVVVMMRRRPTAQAESPLPSDKVIARVALPEEQDEATDHIEAQYDPNRVNMALDDAEDEEAFLRGYKAAQRQVVLPYDG